MKTWKFQQIEPANARGKLKEEYWDDSQWHAEEKLDGHRAIAQFCKESTRFTSRRVSVRTGKFVENTANLPHLNAAEPKLLGTVLDGEIVMFDDSDSMKVSSIMGSKPERAIKLQQETEFVVYITFDCLFFKGTDLRQLSLKERRKYLKLAIGMWGQEPYAGCVRVRRLDKRGFLNKIYKRGGEGIILKDREAVYHQRFWAKVKRVATYDVVVMGFTKAKEESEKVTGKVSTTKYKGQVGAIVFGQYVGTTLKEFGRTSGFDDVLREKFTKDGKSYLGKVMEISCQERIKKTGRFRHPQFKRWRPDKNVRQCVYRSSES